MTVHSISGFASLGLMAIHFGWAAAVVLDRPDGKAKTYFNRFSVPTWALWLIAFSSGLIVRH
jgi:hypothetical protein